MNKSEGRPIEILLVEDSPSDTDLTLEALKDFKVRNHVSVVEDGVQAMQFLRRQGPYAEAPRPDLIMLDLNLPRKDGREVLAEIKADDNLKTIPDRGVDHFARRPGHPARLPAQRQLLHQQAGRFQPVPGGGAVHRIVLAVRGDPAARAEQRRGG